MAEENIQLTKTIYSTKSTDGLVDRSFSEFFKTKDPVDIDRFFSIYNELFYDIPKKGSKSHESIVKQSLDYTKNYYDQRDDEIQTLTERIIELEEQLAEPEIIKEHPFYANGTIISTDDDNENIPDWGNMHYMDKGEKRLIINGAQGEVFKALIASLGYKADTDPADIAKVVPKIVFDGIPDGAFLDIEDLTGQTAAQELEQQTNLLASIVVDDWREELINLIQPIEDGSISNQLTYIGLLKSKIKEEFEREESLESMSWKYYNDARDGYTQEDRDVGQALYELVNPKIIKSRQTLAILARIWAEKANFPNIDFNSILPRSEVGKGVNADKGSAEIINGLKESDIAAFSGYGDGKELFPGVLEGDDYITNISLFTGPEIDGNNQFLNIPEKSQIAYDLLNEGLIKLIYVKEKYRLFGGGWQFDKYVTYYTYSDYQGGLAERYFFIGHQYK